MKKYKLTNETIEHFGKTLYRIKALKSFGIVKKGELGGFIEKESNLSQDGDAWVYEKALVCGDAQVHGNALVCGDAQVYGNAQVCGDARVYGNAQVYENAQVYGDAQVWGDAQVHGNALVWGDAQVFRSYHIVNIIGFKFNITITYQYVKIGCKHFELDELDNIKYEQFSSELSEMEFNYLKAIIDNHLEYIFNKIAEEE
jgi:carbonic anhydrase/acetyltransferase-like protein (isoleucine patch superfamily)